MSIIDIAETIDQKFVASMIEGAVKAAYPTMAVVDFTVERPDNDDHGDFSTNAALVLAKSVGQNPMEVAAELIKQLPAHNSIDKIEAIRPGFINFHLSVAYLGSRLTLAGQVVLPANHRSQAVLFEYGQPNTHKMPHIGHLFSYIYGEACASLLEAVGHSVHRLNYQGDVGLHVAKCLWAYRNGAAERSSDPIELSAKVELLQQSYQQGSAAYEEDENAKLEIDELNRLIYAKDPTIMADWEKTRSWSVEYYAQFERRIGVKFDRYYFESQTSEVGSKLVRDNTDKVFQLDQGAIIFKGEEFGLHTRVFINSAGLPTYEAKDIGLAALKSNDWQFDLSVITTASEQNDYWRVVKKAIELVLPEYIDKIRHIGYGMINLSTGKMGSRTGQIIGAIDLLSSVKQRVSQYIGEHRQYQPDQAEQIAELVALGAIKYSFLSSTPEKNVIFDLDSSIAFEGDSGPYLQYTYARCQSVLAKADQPSDPPSYNSNYLLNSDELLLAKAIDRFSETCLRAAELYAPHILAVYLFDLAKRYSQFYDRNSILAAESAEQMIFRLHLTKATALCLRRGLELLGIEVIDQI